MAESPSAGGRGHYLLTRWAPEKGFLPCDGLQWIHDRVQEAQAKKTRPQQQRRKGTVRFVSANRAGLDGLLGGSGGRRAASSLPFARVTGGLDPAVKEKTEAEVIEKVEELEEKAEEVAKDLRVPVPQTRIPFIGPVHSLVLKQLLCGIVAGGVAGTLITPLEVIKTRVLAGRGGHSVGQVVNRVTQVEGVQSVMQTSFSISILRQAIDKGVQFATYEAVKRTEKKKHMADPKVLPLPRRVPIATLAGAAAGFTSTFFVYPFQVLADRMVLNADAYKGFADAIAKIVREEGWRELFRGVAPALLRMVPSAAASFYTYETLKAEYLRERRQAGLDLWASLTIGAAAGATATTLTYPLEVARKQISFSALPRGAVDVGRTLHYDNVFQALRGIVTKEGVGGLYRGLPLELVEIVPMTAISFAVYEVAKRAFIAVNEERRDEAKGGPDE